MAKTNIRSLRTQILYLDIGLTFRCHRLSYIGLYSFHHHRGLSGHQDSCSDIQNHHQAYPGHLYSSTLPFDLKKSQRYVRRIKMKLPNSTKSCQGEFWFVTEVNTKLDMHQVVLGLLVIWIIARRMGEATDEIWCIFKNNNNNNNLSFSFKEAAS